MATISIEIGSFGIKGCVRFRGKIELLEIGDSMSPYWLPAVANIDTQKNVLVGTITLFSDPLNGKTMYLSEYEHLDDDFSKVFTTLFHSIKFKAEQQAHESVTEALIVIPPYFANKDPRKTKLEEAFRNVGIQHVNFISSDIAVCYHSVNIQDGESVFVYDIGHGATHLSVVKRTGKTLATVSKREVTDCSGRCFENFIYSDIENKYAIDYNDEFQLLQVQYFEKLCRYIKESLTTTDIVALKLPFVNKDYALSRKEFEKLVSHSIETSLKESVDCIQESGKDILDMRQFVISGGGSQIGLIRRMMQAFFDAGNEKPKTYICNTSNQESMYAACKGAFSVPTTSISQSSFTLNI